MKYSKLSNYTIKKILKNFCIELTAVQTAKIMNINRHTVDRYYQIFRERIAEYEESTIKQLSGNIEIDESYFVHAIWEIKEVAVRNGVYLLSAFSKEMALSMPPLSPMSPGRPSCLL